MSFRTWHDYGYGIVVDDVIDNADQDLTVETILNFAKTAPNFWEKYNSWLYENFSDDSGDLFTDLEVSEILEYEGDCCYCGLGVIMKEVILENEGIDFYVCEDFNATQYLIYTPTYPWYMSDKNKNLKEEDITAILRKYVSMITDKPINIDYLECENGG